MNTTKTLRKFESEIIPAGVKYIIIDAGVERLQLHFYGGAAHLLRATAIPSSSIHQYFGQQRILKAGENGKTFTALYVTGKLAKVVRDLLGYGDIIQPAAALWSAAQGLVKRSENRQVDALAVIDLSASGYLVIGIDSQGALKSGLLVVNPRCGAGSRANIDRVLHKLDIGRCEVDSLLAKYVGDTGRQARDKLNIRADRCGVFSSSATISDKNQGIPLDFALAVTLKSEVVKTCRKLPAGFNKVYLTGGVFSWQFTRDCAEDYLRNIGVGEIVYDSNQTLLIDGVRRLVEKSEHGHFFQPEERLIKRQRLIELPSFVSLRRKYMAQHLYYRMPDKCLHRCTPQKMKTRPVIMALDAGSTMAKLVIADAETQDPLFLGSYGNLGDTIEIVKQIFRDLQSQGVEQPRIARIGVTGSARYQIQESLQKIYPVLKDRVSVLVENYAHARGSIELARGHIRRLKSLGIQEVNEDFFILVDIGGEDTKLSTVSLRKGELFDNAMNLKCSAGTGSLMDSLSSLFSIDNVAEASRMAFEAKRSFSINATCAVFLIESARKMQAQGYSKDEILASCGWAIVENMAQTLWSQLDLPGNAVVLLHGQTMLSDPLPLAVTHRLQEFTGSPCYALVPPIPGHRACLGLIKSLSERHRIEAEPCELADFICRQFQKRVVQCHGVACGDKAARCNRTMLSTTDSIGQRIKFSLGGCTAINDLIARKKAGGTAHPGRDTYKEIWDHVNDRMPRTEDPRRLIIPRSFSISEWCYFFAGIFQELGLPVHTDNVREEDLIEAQPLFNTDTCAPQIGAVGQFQRVANEPHGVILVPQIEFLPTGGISMGRTCTINQGGIVVAKNLAEARYPGSRFQLVSLNMAQLNPASMAHQLYDQLGPVFDYYGIRPAPGVFLHCVERALEKDHARRVKLEDLASDIIEQALAEDRQVGIIVGREYVLNPGIYDSHVGRLLRDKQIMAIPSYVLNVRLDPDYAHIYWRNPHAIVSILRAVAEKKLYTLLTHRRLQSLFQRIETRPSDSLLPIVQVSTFRCGPDSVTAPLVAEIMKRRPFLLIQSDAVIKELAHLENRMNTYTRQLQLGLHTEIPGTEDKAFEISILDGFSNTEKLDKENDVIYFPTLSDNRVITAAMRAGGYTCIDNYDDESYNLVDLIKKGRRITGDSVCAPLAAVYGDILRAVEDFSRRRESGDPSVTGKRRLLVFTNKGSGPCRQGQYSEIQKLFAYQTFGPPGQGDRALHAGGRHDDPTLQLLVGEEESGYDIGIDEWIIVRIIQGVILQGVLHGLLFKGGTRCENYEEYQKFLASYRHLKQELYRIVEHKPGPSSLCLKLLETFRSWQLFGTTLKIFAYRLFDRDIHRALRRFSRRWIDPNKEIPIDDLKIYVDGEAYMRTSQIEDIFEHLLSSLGFRRFTFGYSPVWYYLAYLLDQDTMLYREQRQLAEKQMQDPSLEECGNLDRVVRDSKRIISKIRSLRILLRELLARPLYRSAGLNMPDSMTSVLKVASQMMPTLRPIGELGPYIGEVLTKLRKGYDLCINVAPEGCMVSSMGATLTPRILDAAGTAKGQIQNLFSPDGDVDAEMLTLAMLKVLGPETYYLGTQQQKQEVL